MSNAMVVLALFDPCEEELRLRRQKGPYPATRDNLRFLKSVIDHYNKFTETRADIRLALGVFEWEGTP